MRYYVLKKLMKEVNCALFYQFCGKVFLIDNYDIK